VSSALAQALAARPPVLLDAAGLAEAAVALVLAGPGAGEDAAQSFLLIERARFAGDPWSGHLALPGGRRHAGDADLRATAERETHEEVGLDLAHGATFLGRHDDLHGTVQPIVVATFAYALPDFVPLAPGPELVAAEWCPIDRLFEPARQETLRLEWRGRPLDLPAVRVLDDRARPVLWGLTYRLLETLLARAGRPLPQASPVREVEGQ
jgi:8-oxo-dGTP pyrophosphatase MutT (NUDIX family)